MQFENQPAPLAHASLCRAVIVLRRRKVDDPPKFRLSGAARPKHLKAQTDWPRDCILLRGVKEPMITATNPVTAPPAELPLTSAANTPSAATSFADQLASVGGNTSSSPSGQDSFLQYFLGAASPTLPSAAAWSTPAEVAFPAESLPVSMPTTSTSAQQPFNERR